MNSARREVHPEGIAILGLSALGIGVGIYLTVVRLARTTAVCFGGSGCEAVEASRYSTLLGVPVALFGVLALAMVAVATWTWLAGSGRFRKFSMLTVLSTATTGAAYSVFLTAISAFEIRSFCPWCLVSTGCLLAIFALSFRRMLIHSVFRP